MKLTFEAFARPLFGPRYQGAVRALLVSGIVFFGGASPFPPSIFW